MLSLLNKSGGEKSSASQAIPWRPDFRDTATLPDTKTVRTNFFLNLIAVSVAGALLLFVAQREWNSASLGGSLQDVETRIASTAPVSEKAQANYKLYLAEEAKFNEAYAFVRDPFRLSKFILHLGEIMPTGVTIRRIDFRGGQSITVNGSVKGLDAAASDVASGFVKQLQTDPGLTEDFASVALTNLGRNAEEASLNMELLFTFKSAAKGAKK